MLTRWLKQIFAIHSPRGPDMEVANALAICGSLGLRIDREFIAPGDRIASSVILAVLGLLSEDGLLAEPWDNWKPKDAGSAADIVNDRYWLPYYAAVTRKWTKDFDLLASFAANSFFLSFAAGSVSFMDMSDFASNYKPLPLRMRAGTKSGVLQRAPVRSSRQSVSDD